MSSKAEQLKAEIEEIEEEWAEYLADAKDRNASLLEQVFAYDAICFELDELKEKLEACNGQ